LLALGLTETTTGFEGHGFVVANTLVENHTKEYWEELIKGILSVINIVHTPAVPVVTPEMEEIAIQNKIKNRTNRLLELGMVSDGGMNLVGFTFTVHIGQLRNDVDTEFEKLYENIRVASEKAKAVSAPAPMEIVKDNDVNVGERYEERKQKLFAMGMTINGLDFVKYKNSVTVLIVKSCNDLEFEELIANFSKSFEIFEQTVAERIQGLVNLGFEPQGNGTVFAKSDCNSILLEEIQKHTDDEWNSFTGLIAESLVNKAETVQTPIEEYEFVMNPGSPHSYKAYIGAGWNDQQLEQQSLGKLVKKEPQTAAPAPEAPQTPASLLGNDNELEIK
jgi:Fe2+ transport system protein FeoA